jgi:uncharacterized protein (TIGR02266 family)
MACVSNARDQSLDASGERRSASRVEVEAEVSLASDSQFFAGLTGNLSTGGVFVATYRQLPIGCRVVMQIVLADGEVLAEGSVRWIREETSGAPPGLGIAFDGPLGADATVRIERFCALREPLLHDDESEDPA